MKEFSLYHVFSSHMVLQRERPIVFSGRGEAGASFSMTFAGKTQEGVVSSDGTWTCAFPRMNAGGPYELTGGYAGEKPAVWMKDILIGEVWMCSGQSNMEMPVLSDQEFFRALNADWEAGHADYPRIRLYNANETRELSPNGPLDDMSSENIGWLPCNPESVASFSACGYFFGRKLHQDLDVPIGLISASWGGSRIESWISDGKFQEIGWEVSKQQGMNLDEEWRAFFQGKEGAPLFQWLKDFDALGPDDLRMASEEYDDASWTRAKGRVVPLQEEGRFVFRMRFFIPEELAGAALQMNFCYVNDVDRTYVNGQKIGETDVMTTRYWAAARRYSIPAGLVHGGMNTLTIFADNHYGFGAVNLSGFRVLHNGEIVTTALHGVCHECLFKKAPTMPKRPAVLSIFDVGDDMPGSVRFPSTLYNCFWAPWHRYAIRGVIWYQGCDNRGEFSYYPLHQVMIQEVREKWRDPKMPFLIVQLAGFHVHDPVHRPMTDDDVCALPFPDYDPFAMTREIQEEVANAMENVGLVTAIDHGDAMDVHPRNKQIIGLRLAMKAEDMLCWIPQVCDGPTYAGFVKEGRYIRVFFDHVGTGLTTTDGKAPTGFVLGDSTGALKPAEAVIDGDSVILRAHGVHNPQRVRYAFKDFLRLNLVNCEGFPALPFRSDKPIYDSMF